MNVGYYSLSLDVLGHAHLTDFNIATIIKDGERATALAGTKPYMGSNAPPEPPLMTCLLVSFINQAGPIFASMQREQVVLKVIELPSPLL